MQRLVAWNIRAGGGVRTSLIANALAEWQADLVILSEFRSSPPSQELADDLRQQGYVYQVDTCHQVAQAQNAMLIASRQPLKQVHLRYRPKEPGRWLAVRTASGILIGGVHIPNQHTGRKPDFHEGLLEVMQRWRKPAIIAGDTNSGRRGEDEETAVFNRATTEWFDRIEAAGWRDTFRHIHGNKREFTWYSPGHQNGFRLDQAFVSPALRDAVTDCSHRWARDPANPARRDAVSDHAAVILDLSLSSDP